jgi:D-sedoheptulose 7-phosphate isomerase
VSHDEIGNHFEKSRAAVTAAASDATLLAVTRTIADVIASAISNGGKFLIAGNGGSAADAQHVAAEIIGRYKHDRPGYAAIALTTDTSALTAIANDYGFEQVFSRQVQGLGRRGDVFLGISTSGRSPNILAALKVAREQGLVTIGFTGTMGESMRALCDHLLIAPSDEAAVIQQVHMVAAHAICGEVEHALMTKGQKA